MTANPAAGSIGLRTPFVRAAQLGAMLGSPNLYLKLEGANPTGTHKDRIAGPLVAAARRAGAAGVTVGTCGNLGVALARQCHRLTVPCRVFVPARYRHVRRDELVDLDAIVERVRGGYEEAVTTSGQYALENGWYDASPVGPAGQLAVRAYRRLAEEILDECPQLPTSVWLSTGNGTAAAGLYEALRGCPRPVSICVVGSAGNTAVTASIARGHVVELDPRSLHETPANEPLVNWRSLHAAEALAAVVGSGGTSYEATDAELLRMQRLLRDVERVCATPAAAAALAGFAAVGPPGVDRGGVHVVVLTS